VERRGRVSVLAAPDGPWGCRSAFGQRAGDVARPTGDVGRRDGGQAIRETRPWRAATRWISSSVCRLG
jgi:hypothetical protein